MKLLPPSPHSRDRAELLEADRPTNGIDYIEVDPADHRVLTVGLIVPMPDAAAWGLVAQPDRVRILGGERIRGIRTVSVAVLDDRTLRVVVDVAGDFSPYTLELAVAELDPVLRRAVFSFKAACPSDFDCLTPCRDGAPEEPDEPLLDTLAKDYRSFRRMLLDLVAVRHPSQSDRHVADLGITLTELLAAHGDELSYLQDATFAEAYLDTARRRISVRRHVRFVDYSLHEGRNAWTAVHLTVSTPLAVAVGTRLFTRLAAALPGASAPPPAGFDQSILTRASLEGAPFAAATVYETAHTLHATPLNNTIHLHHWGEKESWLPAGATSAWLWADNPAAPTAAVRPALAVGDRIVVEQVKSPTTRLRADADPAQRYLLRITEVADGIDPAYRDVLTRAPDGTPELAKRDSAAQAPLPLLGVRWSAEDAPPRALCVRSVRPGEDPMEDLALVRGNIVLADHGLTFRDVDVTPEGFEASQLVHTGGPGTASLTPPLRLRLRHSPLTFQIGDFVSRSTNARSERTDLVGGPADARAAVSLTVRPLVGPDEVWKPVPDLFDSGPDSAHVVVEVDDEGRALLRPGDGVLGKRILDASSFSASYRVGNGTGGLVGADTLVHIALPAADAGAVLAVRNPLAATGAVEPEPVERARYLAPDAYRTQRRAVVPQDVVDALLQVPGVRAAVAALRWTGSWYTWVCSVLPTDPDDLVDTGGSRQDLSGSLHARVVAGLQEVRLAGYDVAVRAPRFVPVELSLHVCVGERHRRSEVRDAVRHVLLDQRGGLLAAPNLTFGRPLLLGDVYAAVAGVPGVESVRALALRRYGEADDGELAAGRLDVAAWEVIRLDDNPSLPGRGVLRVELDGGRP